MGNGFSEEPDRPGDALGRQVYNITDKRRGTIAGTWKEDARKRRKALQANYDALQEERNTALTLTARKEASSKILKGILATAQKRNESRRAATESIRYGHRNTLRRKTREFAPNAIRNSPIDRLELYLEVPKREGYYMDRKKLFFALSEISDLPKGCNTIFYYDNGNPVTICDIILNDEHTELARAIAAIDRRTFMDRFRSITKLYNDCEKTYPSIGSQAASIGSQVVAAAVSATEEAAAITTNPAGSAVKTAWGWFTGLFTRKNRSSPPSVAQPSTQPPQSNVPETASSTFNPIPPAGTVSRRSSFSIPGSRVAGGTRKRRHTRTRHRSKHRRPVGPKAGA